MPALYLRQDLFRILSSPVVAHLLAHPPGVVGLGSGSGPVARSQMGPGQANPGISFIKAIASCSGILQGFSQVA